VIVIVKCLLCGEVFRLDESKERRSICEVCEYAERMEAVARAQFGARAPRDRDFLV